MVGAILGFLIVIGSALFLISSTLAILVGGMFIMKKLLSGAARGMGIGARNTQPRRPIPTSTGSLAAEDQDGVIINPKSITGRTVDSKYPISPTSSE